MHLEGSVKMVGIMSGSSLDGLDLCLVEFRETSSGWKFHFEKTETYPLEEDMEEALRASTELSPTALHQLDLDYGLWIGNQIKHFLSGEEQVLAVAVHGHTVFHEPADQVSLQIGDGATIANTCGVQVIDTFRIADIIKGGQGAPLVPVGEHYLFSDYRALVNLGGIANVTVQDAGGSRAWDICPCNQVLNFFARKLGQPYDKGGAMAREGQVLKKWKKSLGALSYFQQSPPKSLSNQWGLENILHQIPENAKDALRTYTEFLAEQICTAIKTECSEGGKVLFTGGGAFNTFLMELVAEGLGQNYEITNADPMLVSFKEALIFAFLGLLRLKEQPNVFASVTGATEDTCAGNIHLPQN